MTSKNKKRRPIRRRKKASDKNENGNPDPADILEVPSAEEGDEVNCESKSTEVKALALFTVYNKKGVGELARILHGEGYTIVSCGGTLSEIARHEVPCIDVTELTSRCSSSTADIMSGRLKTLQVAIHGGILASEEEMKELQANNITPINFVVCNMAPPGDNSIEGIDIGGSCLIRSAAKNYRRVTVVTNPEDYSTVTKELLESGVTSIDLRRKLAEKAIIETGNYDSSVLTPAKTTLNDTKPTTPLNRAEALYSLVYGSDHRRYHSLCEYLSNSDLRREVPPSERSVGAYLSGRRSALRRRRSNPFGSTAKVVDFYDSSEGEGRTSISVHSCDFAMPTPTKLRKCLVTPGSRSKHHNQHVDFASESDTGEPIHINDKPFPHGGRDKRYSDFDIPTRDSTGSHHNCHVGFPTESDIGEGIHFEDRPFPHEGRDKRYSDFGIPTKRNSSGPHHVGFRTESDIGEGIHFEDRPFPHEGRDKRYSDFGIPTKRDSSGPHHVGFRTESDNGEEIHFEDRPFPHEGRDKRYSDFGIPTKRNSSGPHHVGFRTESDIGEGIHFEDRPFPHEGRDKRYSDFGIPTKRDSSGPHHVGFRTESDAGNGIHFEDRPFPHEGRDKRYSDFGIPAKRTSSGRKSHVEFCTESDNGEEIHFEDRPFPHEGRDKRYSDFGIPTKRNSSGPHHVGFRTESDIGEEIHFEDRPFPHEGRDKRYRTKKALSDRRSQIEFAASSDTDDEIPPPRQGRTKRYSDFGIPTKNDTQLSKASIPPEQRYRLSMLKTITKPNRVPIRYANRRNSLTAYVKRSASETPASKIQRLQQRASASNYVDGESPSARFSSLRHFIEESEQKTVIPSPEIKSQKVDSSPRRLSQLVEFLHTE
eukprot:TRINITY_DN1263_c0_g1_i2.p1 TRINITY_DN1263_c0_g1~~TRINITY_DN1263_c0_g1_i2.p1  ORF type:complete len:873 (+),score=169.73 TRINITY_DN1263_c0_g1_i2:43-2661(+)